MSAPGGGPRRFDAVVVGAGVAGLTAALLLARAGRRVALLEAGDRAGGLCRTVRAGGFAWDLSLYSLRGAETGGPFAALLGELGIARRLDLRHAAASYLVRLDDRDFPVTTARDEMLAAADRLERGGADRLGPFLERMLAFDPVRDYGRFARLPFADAAASAGIGGQLLTALAAPLMISLGLPPGRVSTYFAFLKYRLLLAGGVSHPEGGAEALVRAMEWAFSSSGGSFFPGTRVEAVAVEPDSARRVETAAGAFVADDLVLAVDATTALGWLAAVLPEKWRAKPARLTPSLSASLLFASAPAAALRDAGLGRAPQAIVVRDPDFAGIYERLRAGDAGAADGVVGVTSPAAWPLAGPEDADLPLSAFFLAPPGERADPAAGELLARLERAVPALAGRVAAHAAWGPRELAARTGNRDGAFCGWEMTPERYGPARIPANLPIPGVHLAGHWTDPGPSVLNAMLSGRSAARAAKGAGAVSQGNLQW